MLEPNLTSWKAQYARLVRSYERVLQPYKSSVEYDDDLQHYFQDCWHLKDWIKNDQSTGTVVKNIEKEVEKYQALQAIGDLANAAKHFKRHTDRVGAYVTSTNVTVHLGQDKPIDLYYVVTLSDGTTLTAQALVHEGFRVWNDILSSLDLQP